MQHYFGHGRPLAFVGSTGNDVRSEVVPRPTSLNEVTPQDVAASLLTGNRYAEQLTFCTCDRILIEVGYAGGLRVSELVSLTWSDVIERDGGRVQLSVLGKGHKRREVLLPEVVARSLVSLRGDAGANDPVFASPRGGHLTERAVNYMLKRAATNAGINPKLSAHWLRHAHASHAIDRGAALPVVQSTLGHGNIAVTSGYLHARPGDSSGLHLDEGVFLQRG